MEHDSRTTFERVRMQFDGNECSKLPSSEDRPTGLAQQLDDLAQRLAGSRSRRLTRVAVNPRGDLQEHEHRSARSMTCEREWTVRSREQMIALQEELDWECYRLYGLIDEELTYRRASHPDVSASAGAPSRSPCRAKIAPGNFRRPGSSGTTRSRCPGRTPSGRKTDQDLVRRRMEVIATDRNIALIEAARIQAALEHRAVGGPARRGAARNWLLDRLESYSDFDGRMNEERRADSPPPHRVSSSVGKLADVARQDPEFLQVGELYRDDPAFDVSRLVAELVEAESVPLLPILRYKPSGLRKREEWEKTWALQRQEDAIDARTKLPRTTPTTCPSWTRRNSRRSRSAPSPSRPSTRAPTS